MSDNPMYWPGHQRPAWHQQAPTAGQQVNAMSQYATHPGSMLANPMGSVMPGDPSLQMQSSIPSRHQPPLQSHQATLSQHQSLPPPGAQSSLYPSMMPGQGAPNSVRPTAAQLTSNSHLSSATQGMPPLSSIQQPTHAQSHYSHQYPTLATSYWNPPTLSQTGGPNSSNSQVGPGPPPPPPQSDGTSAYHSSSISPLTMPNENRSSLASNSNTTMQQSAQSFHSTKDLQSSSDHLMSYDRQRGSSMSHHQQHSSATMMSQSVTGSNTSNLSPTHSQLSMQGRLQSQTQLDSMRSMPQQPPSVSNWSSSYYGQPSPSPYSSVMNPYMPYASSSAVPNHANSASQQPTRPSMGQKPSTNGNDRVRGSQTTHSSSIYGQPPPSTGSTNSNYYGYDSYYNPTSSQASDPYLTHSNPASAVPQHWSATNSGGLQLISNNPAASVPMQATLRPQTGSTSSVIHPLSPSASSTLPPLSSRQPLPSSSQNPDRSPAQQHATSYPSPSQLGSSSKSTSNSLAQLEQMVMPNSSQPATQATKSPTQRSSTSSPSTNAPQQPAAPPQPPSQSSQPPQQLQYSYNSSGQGTYFSTSSGTSSNQNSYYSQYESGLELQKSNWQEPVPIVNSLGQSTVPVMIESSQSGYAQGPNYDGSTTYSEYTPLSAPVGSCNQPTFPTNDTTDASTSDKTDPYAIESQTFEDYDDQPSLSKPKKSRAKKGEEKAKKERKPRAPRVPKAGVSSNQPSPANVAPPPPLQIKAPTPDLSPATQQSHQQQPSSFLSPSQQSSSMKSSTAETTPHSETVAPLSEPKTPLTSSPAHRLSTESPCLPVQSAPQHIQLSYNSSDQTNHYSTQKVASIAPDQASVYPPRETQSEIPKPFDPSMEMQKPNWQEPISNTVVNPLGQSSGPAMIESGHINYAQGTSYDSSTSYGEYTPLSVPSTNSAQANFSSTDISETTTSEKTVSLQNEPHSIEEQQEFQAPPAKPKKSRAKKGDERTKRERKPRAPRPPKSSSSTNPLFSPSNNAAAAASPSQQQKTTTPDESSPAQQQGSSSSPQHLESEMKANAAAISCSTAFAPPTKSSSNLDYNSNDPSNHNTSSDLDPTGHYLNLQSESGILDKATSNLITDDGASDSKPARSTGDSTPAEPKPRRIRIRDSSSKGKKKLPKFALKFAKTKKRKRLGSSDNDQSDLEKTPPPSPDEIETGVQKRRSTRNTKKLKYNDDIELDFSDSDDESQILPRKKSLTAIVSSTVEGDNSTIDETVIADEPTVFAAPVEDTMVVEKIMASRSGKRELEPEPGEVLPVDGTHIEVEEFFVKYKNLSYMHCDWRTLEELEKGDRRVAQKLKRYKQKKDSSNLFSFMDEDLFDPQYCEVDRILAVNEVEEMVPDDDDAEKDDTKLITQVDAKEERVNEIEKTKDEVSDVDDTEKSSAVALDNESNNDKVKINEISELMDVTAENSELKQSDSADIDKDSDLEVCGQVPVIDEVQPGLMNSQKDAEILTLQKPAENLDPIDDTHANTEVKPKKMKKKISRHYLVKWRGLSYEDSTWELEDDLDTEKIKHFERFKDPPPKSKWKQVKRPKPEEWVRKEVSPVYKNNNTLREYQLEGINWLSFCWHQGRNCILADEMGLGKTIQSIAFVNEIYQHGINGPFLIIVPLSTVGNWAREFETWTDLNVITYHGSSTSREMLKEYEMFYRNKQGNRITSYYKFQVMITTFEIILSDCLDLREIPWRCCIIDEAHRLKNRNCKLLEGLRLLNMEHRVLLTGTPLQNNVEELFSLLNFLEPTQFSSTEQFLQEFGDLKTEAQVDKLKVILKPMMLRRLKEDVEKTLAPKEETIVEVELTNIQKKYYRAILEKNFSFLTKGSSSNNMPNLMNTMMELRKCCIHPYLINGAEEQILYEARQAKLAGGEPMSSYQAMINSSGKLVLIDKLLPRLRADGHRVLIFSQMVRCLDILEDYVTHKHYPFERIDGRVRGSDRQQAIDRFSKPGSDRFVFLLCTRAGGLGINLTAADTVIIFDSDWNPQNDLQAQARCHRIGQSKAVKIYRLICRNTYEREMFDKASLKLGLDKAVLQSMNTQKGGAGGLDGQLTKKEIEELLRKGAYGALMDDDNAGDKFCEEDIDQILQRRTQVITIDNSEAKGSTFSKATFSSSNNREDIELDDPNFWEKWAKKANIETDEMRNNDELIQLAPRRRTQTKRYGADGNLLDISDLDSSDEDEETISMRTRGSRGRQPKLTPSFNSKRSKRNRPFEFDDDEYSSNNEVGFWSKTNCIKLEKGLLTHGWGRWNEILAGNRFEGEITPEEAESICRVILLYCLYSYKGDEKIKSFVWELITPMEELNKAQAELDSNSRNRKPKSAPLLIKKTIADEISDARWPKESKYDPEICLPDDQYRRHLQRNSNRLLIRVKLLHYLKDEILKGYDDKILADCNVNEVDLPAVPVDGDLPASWWDDDADKSLLVGIFKHGHDKFSLMRQDPCLCFLQRCGPPNKAELMTEMNCTDRSIDEFDDDNRDSSSFGPIIRDSVKAPVNSLDSISTRDTDAGKFLDNLVDNVVKDLTETTGMEISDDVFDENKNSILKNSQDRHGASRENGISGSCQTIVKMDVTDDESLTNEESIDAAMNPEFSDNLISDHISSDYLPFPSANDLNQRFRRLITAYQRNSKKLEIKLAQKVRDELKKERTSKFEAAKNEREERKRFLAQKWSRREEADFFRTISSFGVEYDAIKKKHDWNKFKAIGKLDKKLDETLDEYYRAFLIMCKRVLSRPLLPDEENCPIHVDTITEERASKCLSRIEFLNKIRENIITHPELSARLSLCHPQAELPDWWVNGKHDKDLLIAAAKHGITRLDYNLAHDVNLSFDALIRQKAELMLSQPPSPILIPLDHLQELLERNGIEYLKELDLSCENFEVRATLDSILGSIESLENASNTDYNPTSNLADGDSHNVTDYLTSTFKTTHGSSTLDASSSSISENDLVKTSEQSSANSVRLSNLGYRSKEGDHRVVEITPILPDKLPEELVKNFEAGEISITIQSESALLKLDDRAPIVLFGATNPVTVKIRWPKDKAIQTRLENLVYLIENNEWPSPPRPLVPTITLPSHLTSSLNNNSLSVNTSSPSKNDKSDLSVGSPKSDISNISSPTSKQDSKERTHDILSSKVRRGRSKRSRLSDNNESMPMNLDSPQEDRQATAKLRNLLSQGPGSRAASTSTDKLNAKFHGNKQNSGLSSLLDTFKQARSDIGGSRNREGSNLLDLNAGAANLLPQILANMKPEFRDLLANQDAATMLFNSLSSIAGTGNLVSNLRSSGLGSQISIENALNPARSSKGPPPAHQRSDNLPSTHSSSSARDHKRAAQNTRANSPPSINLRSNRTKGSIPNTDTLPHHKSDGSNQIKMLGGGSGSSSVLKKRSKSGNETSEIATVVPGADVLDLSSLPTSYRGGPLRPEQRSRRYRDQIDDQSLDSSRLSSHSSKSSLRSASSKIPRESELHSEKETRTTRASKRIGSRIDALALNLQAKKLHISELSPPLPKDGDNGDQDRPIAAHGSVKSSSEHKTHSSNAPPAAHSNSSKFSSSRSTNDQTRKKVNNPGMNLPSPGSTAAAPSLKTSTPSTVPGSKSSVPGLQAHAPASSASRQDSLAQLMSNPSSLLAGLNQVGGAGDLMNQLLRKTGPNIFSKRSSSSLLAQQTTTSQMPTNQPPSNQSQSSHIGTTGTNQTPLPNAGSLNIANQFGGLGGLLAFPGMNELIKQISGFPGLNTTLPSMPGTVPLNTANTTQTSGTGGGSDKGNRRSRHSTATAPSAPTSVSSQQAASAALTSSLMSLASQPGASSIPYGSYTNPLTNPFLPFGLANLGINNPLGMGLFPNLYMPPGFPSQQATDHQVPPPRPGASSDAGSKDKKSRYSRK